jgi:anaphase-promoting complex subunit 3
VCHTAFKFCFQIQLAPLHIGLDARNPLAKYEKASVLLSDDRFQEALQELEALKQVGPGGGLGFRV